MNQLVEQLFSKSALSSPRPPTLSSLATNKTSEILSPGFAVSIKEAVAISSMGETTPNTNFNYIFAVTLLLVL